MGIAEIRDIAEDQMLEAMLDQLRASTKQMRPTIIESLAQVLAEMERDVSVLAKGMIDEMDGKQDGTRCG